VMCDSLVQQKTFLSYSLDFERFYEGISKHLSQRPRVSETCYQIFTTGFATDLGKSRRVIGTRKGLLA